MRWMWSGNRTWLRTLMSKIRGRVHMSKEFQNKYVGYMLVSLVGGVLLIGLVGLMLMVMT